VHGRLSTLRRTTAQPREHLFARAGAALPGASPELMPTFWMPKKVTKREPPDRLFPSDPREDTRISAPIRGWTARCHDEPSLPSLLCDGAPRPAPLACYQDVAVSDGVAWAVGGTSFLVQDHRRWPVGEGIVVRFGKQPSWLAVPSTPLLAAAAIDDTHAWASGYDGRLVKLSDRVEAEYVVPGKPWLLAAVTVGHNAWFVGEDFVGRIHETDDARPILEQVSPTLVPRGTYDQIVVEPSGALRVVGTTAELRIEP
jgi:hypothetical protein